MSKETNGIITITDPLIIRLAWGPRRVTSSKRYGGLSPDQAYPDELTAAEGLWMDWIIAGVERWREGEWRIVVPDTKAEARILDQLQDILGEPKESPNESPALSDEEIEALIAKRDALRAEKKFSEADAIRDRLTESGVAVADQRMPA